MAVERLCQIMDISPRGYRAYHSQSPSQSQRKDMVVLAHIRGYSCDDCEARDIKILIDPAIGLGISLTSEKGYRTLLVRK